MSCPYCGHLEVTLDRSVRVGNPVYFCPACQSQFFSSDSLSPAGYHLDVNLIRFRQKKYRLLEGTKTESWVEMAEQFLERLTQGIGSPGLKYWLAVSVLYQIGLIVMIGAEFAKTPPGLNWTRVIQELGAAWDARHYILLSQRGYSESGMDNILIVFFPFYPLLIRYVSFFTRNPTVAALLITTITSIVGHTFFARFLEKLGYSRSKVWRIMLLLFCSPIAVYFSIPYTEATFLAETSLLLLALTQSEYSVAAIAGFCAALTRSLGMFAVIPYVFYFFEAGIWRERWRNLSGGMLIPLGMGIYLVMNHVIHGDFRYFQVVQRWQWQKFQVNPITQYLANFNGLWVGLELDDLTQYLDWLTTILSPILVGVYVGLKLLRRERLSLGLLAWTIAQLTVIISVSFWLSNTRYLALVLPLYIMLEEVLWTMPTLYFLVLLGFISIARFALQQLVLGEWVF